MIVLHLWQHAFLMVSSVQLIEAAHFRHQTGLVLANGNSSVVNVTELRLKFKSSLHHRLPNFTLNHLHSNASRTEANRHSKKRQQCDYLCLQCLDCCNCNGYHDGCTNWITGSEGTSVQCSEFCGQCENCDNLDSDETCPFGGDCCPDMYCPAGWGLC